MAELERRIEQATATLVAESNEAEEISHANPCQCRKSLANKVLMAEAYPQAATSQTPRRSQT
jgi:F0F1-type ATP synthase membrane subunit b/b'